MRRRSFKKLDRQRSIPSFNVRAINRRKSARKNGKEGRKFAATYIVESTLFPASAVEYFIIVINTVQMRRGFKRGVINEIKYRHFRR